jgi:FkbM family methyltransferase
MSDDLEYILVKHPCHLAGRPANQFYIPKGDIQEMLVATARYTEFGLQATLFQRSARGGSYLEVGANIGTDTVLASEFFKVCHVFEPSSQNVRLLRKNLELNGVSNFKIYPFAVGERGGEATLYLGEDRNVGGATLKPGNPESRRQEKVEIVTLDQAMPDDVTDITYMHIDTEGHDIQVLKGASKLLARQKQRPVVRIEFAPRALRQHGSEIGELMSIMESNRFIPVISAGGTLAPLSKSILTELFELWKDSQAWIDIYLCP